MKTKAILKPTESEGCVATSPSGKKEIKVEHNKLYDFVYDKEDNFYLVVDDVLFEEISTAFDFLSIISLAEYAEKVGAKKESKTLQEIQDYVEENEDWTIWDYPIEEYNYCYEQEINVVLVETNFGLRLCEI